MSRRGKYHKWLTDDGLILIEGWARQGLNDEQIAHNIGITTKTLYEWKKRYSAISEALKKGKEVVDFEVENALLKKALGYSYKEETQEEGLDGELTTTKVVIKHMPPDITAQIFWLKNRKNMYWSNKEEAEIEKIKADKDLTVERTKLLKGVEKDTGMIKELVSAIEGAKNGKD